MTGLLLILLVFAVLLAIDIAVSWRKVKRASFLLAEPMRPPEFDGTEPVVTRRDRLPR